MLNVYTVLRSVLKVQICNVYPYAVAYQESIRSNSLKIKIERMGTHLKLVIPVDNKAPAYYFSFLHTLLFPEICCEGCYRMVFKM